MRKMVGVLKFCCVFLVLMLMFFCIFLAKGWCIAYDLALFHQSNQQKSKKSRHVYV